MPSAVASITVTWLQDLFVQQIHRKKKKSQKNDKQENCLSSSYWEHEYKHNILNYLKTVHFNKSLQQQLKSVFSHT